MRLDRKGFISIEIVVAIALMLTFIGVIASLGHSFGRLNRNSWQRHTCTVAAQAQLDAVEVLGRPIPEETFRELWPKIESTVEISDGQGQWKGLERVDVQVLSVVREKTVNLTFTRYMEKDRKVLP
jgi:hypothetical protein